MKTPILSKSSEEAVERSSREGCGAAMSLQWGRGAAAAGEQDVTPKCQRIVVCMYFWRRCTVTGCCHTSLSANKGLHRPRLLSSQSR